MKSIDSLLATVVVLTLTLGLSSPVHGDASNQPQPPKLPEQSRIPGEVFVKLKEDVRELPMNEGKSLRWSKGRSNPGEHPLHARLRKVKAKSGQQLFPQRKNPAAGINGRGIVPGRNPAIAAGRKKLERWYRIDLPADADLDEVIAVLMQDATVETAEPNYQFRIDANGLPDAITDPGMAEQYHHTLSSAQQTWSFLKTNAISPGGRSDVTIAVIDTGVDYTHPDLVANMWVNPAEVPANGIDDDGNGYVDDIHGCSTVGSSNTHGGDPQDLHGHGTHVAGIAAATAFNGRGGVGVAFNARIMAIRSAQYTGLLTFEDVAEGLLYATEHGADVINMSFGSTSTTQLITDALSLALNQCVLVGSAGNKGKEIRNYPAAYPWVLGVMSCGPDGNLSSFSNRNSKLSTWYEVMAPGESIYSTLPGNTYNKWSGTSMAAPVVSGIAALMRSYYSDKNTYSSRFLMGNMAAFGGEDEVIDSTRAVTEVPAPAVEFYDSWLFDDPSVDPEADDDGRFDSGETVHLAIELLNKTGSAKDIVGTLRTQSSDVVPEDPYVTITVDTVAFGSTGPLGLIDNGLIYNSEGVIAGVESPFVVSISQDCPNNHIISFELEIQYADTEGKTYTRVDGFKQVVQRGVNLPGVVESGDTLVLDPDKFWIVGGPVLIEEGATLRVPPGTEMQWGAISNDPLNPGPQSGYILVRGNIDIEGSADSPVVLSPSYLVSGQTVNITCESSGRNVMSYARVRNPKVSNFFSIDHCDFQWDRYSSTVTAGAITHTAFHKFRGGGTISASLYDTILFDAGWIAPANGHVITNSVFLQDNENNRPLNLALPISFADPPHNDFGDVDFWWRPQPYEGDTFVVLPLEHASLRLAEAIANYHGGHVASIRSQEEEDFVRTYLAELNDQNTFAFHSPGYEYTTSVYIGLADWGSPGVYRWLDESPAGFTNWADGYQSPLPEEYWVQVCKYAWPGGAVFTWDWRHVPPGESIRGGPNGNREHWKSFLLRLPGTWRLEDLNSSVSDGGLVEYLKENFHQTWSYNAFLNKNWDPDLGHWMRLTSPGLFTGFCMVRDNFWGTGSGDLVDYMIQDYYDGFLRAKVDYGTPPVHGFETTWPFVESVLVNGVSVEHGPQLQTGLAVFTITYNRDMDTSVVPLVTFGPAVPFTDFTVTPTTNGPNGWISPKVWEGVFHVVPVTGDGYHQMRISGAVAADDPWLVSGYDVGRFRFQVKTMGVEAMTLQAEGREGAVQLSWQQDDYELIAGYNLYRSNAVSGTYTRINDTIIPVGQESFTDTEVTPGTSMYYQFSVLLTDFTESDLSNVASAAAIDTIIPVIVHTPVTSAPPGSGVKITAEVTDNLSVASVTAFFRPWGGTEAFSEVSMTRIEGNRWSGTIPGGAVLPPGLEYYLVTSDGVGTSYSGTVASPSVIVVSSAPTIHSVSPPEGPGDGGTLVTISGTLFQTGAEVLFGGVPATGVQVFGNEQIACVSPPHFPGMVDVRVVNSDATEAVRFNGFRFVTDEVVLSLPDVSGDQGTVVEIPLELSNVTGLGAAEGVVTYDPSVLSIDAVHLGALTQGWTLSTNTGTSGRIQFAMANSSTIGGSGSLLVARFVVLGNSGTASPLNIDSALLNDGAIAWQGSDGLFSVTGRFALGGSVRYFAGDLPVEGVDLSLAGSGLHAATTDSSGAFSMADVLTGSYTLTPTKSDDIDGITAFDASLILQKTTGNIALSPSEAIAADVNRNGAVSSMDALFILQKSVGLIEAPFPGDWRVWDFAPRIREYPLLNDDKSGQDFTAILIGDVSGSWAPASPAPGLPQDPSLQGDPGSEVETVITGIPLPTANRHVVRILTRSSTPLLLSADLILTHHPSARLVSSTGALTMAVNDTEPGLTRIGMAGGAPVSPNAVLVTLVFESDVPPGVTLQGVSFNESNLTPLSSQELGGFDGDGDGLLDVDEIEFLHTSPSESDSDRDGNTDYLEVVAGTDPEDPLDFFALNWANDNGQPVGLQLQWPTKAGRIYILERAASPAGPWTGFHQESGNGSPRSHSLPTNEPHEFFRIRIQLDE